MKYETGATSPAVNDLILFTDSTRQTAEFRDTIYKTFDTINEQPQHYNFGDLIRLAKALYYKEFPGESSRHIKEMSYEQIKEYCTIYAQDFEDWREENK